ncbi:MAG: NAD(P)(+) transhydrogenase (Re/Si-specific) subunit beta [Pirellulaceae bacterium]|jgi:NAD(P) transhydrogenase subunit beta|nr:NAD(P)(+) transhydrogenase (Re/Si-specific) subunit beta [Pirellulaceae bacterium]
MNSVLLQFTDLAYLIAAVLFILGLKNMAHPRTAVRGNVLGMLGMGVAIVTPLLVPQPEGYLYIVAGLALGSAIGAVTALRVQMTSMPQMVALLNGFGGLASVLVAGADLLNQKESLETGALPTDVLVAIAASVLIGAVTFCGSLLAFGKLEEYRVFKQPIRYPLQQPLNALLGLAALVLAGLFVHFGQAGDSIAGSSTIAVALLAGLTLIGLVLGLTLVNPIGGADMPVVISLLNSYSGIAAGMTGFVIANNVLIVSGALVGASGIILTQIMCKAMNRSLFNVLFGVLDAGQAAQSADEVYAKVRSTTAEDVALLLDGVQHVVFVPGYGMAVAQAQHAVRDLGKTLEERGVNVEYAIHPVAGRMPGHMNVLLAEADVSYDKLIEMDVINPTMDTVDVAIVIGANDVVNPVAKTDPQSPIAGMPILEVDRCRTVIVIKRSLSPGFAGIPNPLFAADNTLMLFADGKDAVMEITKAVKAS